MAIGMALAGVMGLRAAEPPALRVVGVSVTPHVRATGMRFRRDPGPADGALVRVVVTPADGAARWSRAEVRFDGRTGREMVESGAWAWTDCTGSEMGASDAIRPGELTVVTFNTRAADHGMGAVVALSVAGRSGAVRVPIRAPDAWLAAATFFGDGMPPRAQRAVLHVVNSGRDALRVTGLRVWQPLRRERFWALVPVATSARLRTLPADGRVAPGEQAIVTAQLPLELTNAVLGLDVRSGRGGPRTLWAHLKVKREAFDISGGWVDGGRTRDGRSPLTHPEFVKTLAGIHVNTAHYGEVAGFSDQTAPDSLTARYPLKRFHMLQPVERYDRDEMLDRIHAVEFLGEPQYGGGRPVPPQEVWDKLHPYAPTRLPTTVTLSDEATWRFYAGLSDYPHYDAYRVNAPSADAWRLYDRWGGERIAWGAPLETIGEMSRSLREMSRPAPTAYWSQGPGDWQSYGGRKRRAPTCDEIRLQAYHALATRITSLYWFNLSLESILKFPDTLAELRRVGREIRMLEDLYLEGAAYRYRRVEQGGRPGWDLASIVAPEAAVLFALDLDYRPDREQKVFVFGPPRDAVFEYALPAWLRRPAQVFRVDAEGVHTVRSRPTRTGVRIEDRVAKVGIYVAARSAEVRERIEARWRELVARERSLGFDPIESTADLEALRAVAGTAQP